MNEAPFVFRGKRNYVLGADILNAVLHGFYGHTKTHELDYVVKRPCTTSSYRLVAREDATPSEEIQAIAQLRDIHHHVLIMPEGAPVTERMPCLEKEMATYFSYNTKLPNKPIVHVDKLYKGEPFTKTCVAAFKYLLNVCVFHEQRQYLFVRLRLETTDISEFSIQFERIFAKRFFEATISVQGKPCGQIFFGGRTA